MSFLGILMLDTRFPRPLGDIGNRETFAALDIPVQYRTVRGASPVHVVRQNEELALQPFVEAAQALVDQGACMLSTSCGFLARYQRELQSCVAVPVISSSLMWLVSSSLVGQRVGVLTIDETVLDASHFAGVGADPATPVQGVSAGCEFQRRIIGNDVEMDVAQAQRDVVAAALKLTADHPDMDTIVFECTNMAPYACAVSLATGRRVEHIVSLVAQTWRSVA